MLLRVVQVLMYLAATPAVFGKLCDVGKYLLF